MKCMEVFFLDTTLTSVTLKLFFLQLRSQFGRRKKIAFSGQDKAGLVAASSRAIWKKVRNEIHRGCHDLDGPTENRN